MLLCLLYFVSVLFLHRMNRKKKNMASQNSSIMLHSKCSKDADQEKFFSDRKSTTPSSPAVGQFNDHFTELALEFNEAKLTTEAELFGDITTLAVFKNKEDSSKYKTNDSGCGQSIDDSLNLNGELKNVVELHRGFEDPKVPSNHGTPKRSTKLHRKATSIADGVTLGCQSKRISPADFEFLSVIGKGSFGKVMLAKRRKNRKMYAIKVLNKKMIAKRNETKHVLSERSVLIQVMKHPFLVTLHYAFTTEAQIFFVLDYVNGGELFYHLQKERVFPEARAKFYAAEMCCALAYMHSKGIIYRDLKPENILLDKDGHVILTDFGLCKEGLESPNSRTSTFCGTPEYLAPEILLKKPYTRSVDWWTLGAVLYEMLYGLPPFYSKDTKAMYDGIIHKALRLRPTASLKARDILSLVLRKDPQKRLGAGIRDGHEIKDHDFFCDIKWNLLEKRQVKPPYIPYVKSDMDISNIDPTFTRERVSIGANAAAMSLPSEGDEFIDFNYAIPGSFIYDNRSEI